MLVAIAMAALSFLGARGNYRNLVKIGGSMPTGSLPAVAIAGGRAPIGANAAAGVAIGAGPGPGAFGVGGALMVRHDAESGGEKADSPRAEQPKPDPEAELEPVKPQTPGNEVSGRATVGLAGRVLSAAEATAFDAFGARARALGWVESPFRTGSWGELVAGKFRELGRIDVAEAGKPGWRGRTHIHITGQPGHLAPVTPLPGE
jgi:hypothetical protein